MSSLSKLCVRGSVPLVALRTMGLSKARASLQQLPLQTSLLMNSKLLLATLLSTTTVAATHTDHILSKPTAIDRLTTPPQGCCVFTPLVYSKRYWSHQTCIAGDLIDLPYIGHLIGRTHAIPSARFFATDIGEEECHQWYDIDTQDFVEMVRKSQTGEEHLKLFDVREPEELQETGEIPGSINIPLGTVEEAFNMSPEDFQVKYGVEKPTMDDPNIVFSCRAGVRSLSAIEAAHHLGYTNARHYMRGWLGWEEHLEKDKNKGS